MKTTQMKKFRRVTLSNVLDFQLKKPVLLDLRMRFRYQSSSHDPWTNSWTNRQAAFFGKERNSEVVGIISNSKTKNPF